MPVLRVRKSHFHCFSSLQKSHLARNKNLRPVLILALWRGNVVSNLLTFGHWKVVFSPFLILYRAFSHFMYLTFCQFCKRKRVQSWFQKLFWNQNCDVVGNLVWRNWNVQFLCVCLFTCLKMVQSWFQKVFWNPCCYAIWIWLWNFQFETFSFFHSTLV